MSANPAKDAGSNPQPPPRTIRAFTRPSYDLRSTFASDSLAAGTPSFQLARVMGTSGQMIEAHYGRLLDGAGAEFADRLDRFDAQQQADDEARAEGG